MAETLDRPVATFDPDKFRTATRAQADERFLDGTDSVERIDPPFGQAPAGFVQ